MDKVEIYASITGKNRIITHNYCVSITRNLSYCFYNSYPQRSGRIVVVSNGG
jgi:hypothetical protein